MIEAYCPDEKLTEVKECLNYIITSCCRLLKTTTLNSRLAAAVDKALPLTDTIAVDSFFGEICGRFMSALPNKCTAVYGSPCGSYIKSNRPLFTYFILTLIRPLLDSCNDSFKLSVLSKSDGECVTVEISADGACCNNVKNDDDITSIFAEALNAKYSFGENNLTIILREYPHDGKIIFETDRLYQSDSLFSIYNVMLSDIEGFRRFYE